MLQKESQGKEIHTEMAINVKMAAIMEKVEFKKGRFLILRIEESTMLIKKKNKKDLDYPVNNTPLTFKHFIEEINGLAIKDIHGKYPSGKLKYKQFPHSDQATIQPGSENSR